MEPTEPLAPVAETFAFTFRFDEPVFALIMAGLACLPINKAGAIFSAMQVEAGVQRRAFEARMRVRDAVNRAADSITQAAKAGKAPGEAKT